jgi:GR25 family glycosyltransferase involved in LPS biosynthesis
VGNTKIAPFWDAIDAVLIINLVHRTDRWNRLYKRLEEIGVADKVHRIDAVLGKNLKGYLERPWFRNHTPERVSSLKAGSAGCCLSQKKVIRYAKDHGFKRILMLEDDAMFRDDLNGRQGEMLADVMKDDSAWDMIYLGYYQRHNKHFVARREEVDGKPFELWRIRGPLLNHAIVLNCSIFDAWLEKLPDEENIWPWMTYWGSIDAWVQNKFGRQRKVKIWGTTPRLVVQTPNIKSDIVGRELSVAESEGTHRSITEIPLDEKAFARCINLSPGEHIYQFLKRSGRVIRAYLFGYRKS